MTQNKTSTLDDNANATMGPYVLVYWREEDGIPAPTGIYGNFITESIPPEAQRREAKKLLDLIQAPEPNTGALAFTASPVSVLVKVPSTNRVKFLLGMSPCLKDPFSEQPSAVHGDILAIHGDIDDPQESPSIITLPADALEQKQVKIPHPTAFRAKLEAADNECTGSMWFTTRWLTGDPFTQHLAKVAPLPPYLVYDALNTEVEAHKLYDRLVGSALATESPEVWDYATSFLMAVHTKQAANTADVELGVTCFLARLHPHAKQWARDQAAKLFPCTIQTIVSPSRAASTDMDKSAQAITALD